MFYVTSVSRIHFVGCSVVLCFQVITGPLVNPSVSSENAAVGEPSHLPPAAASAMPNLGAPSIGAGGPGNGAGAPSTTGQGVGVAGSHGAGMPTSPRSHTSNPPVSYPLLVIVH